MDDLNLLKVIMIVVGAYAAVLSVLCTVRIYLGLPKVGETWVEYSVYPFDDVTKCEIVGIQRKYVMVRIFENENTYTLHTFPVGHLKDFWYKEKGGVS